MNGYQTGLTEEEIAEAFSRALHDLTDAQIRALVSAEAAARETALAGKVSTAEFEAGQAAQETEAGIIANAGAKNLFRCTYMPGESVTVGGVTFTFNADGSITANGTKTNNDWLRLSVGNALKPGTYTLSSDVNGNNTGKIVIITTGDSLGSAIFSTAGSSAGTYTRTLTQDYTDLRYAIRIASGTVCEGDVFRIMLRRAEITDDSFVPYAPTNRELYEMILAGR